MFQQNLSLNGLLKYSLEQALRLARNFQKENKEIAIKSLSFFIFIILYFQIIVKGHSSSHGMHSSSKKEITKMLFPSRFKINPFYVFVHTEPVGGCGGRSKGQFLSQSNILLPPCGSVLHGCFFKLETSESWLKSTYFYIVLCTDENKIDQERGLLIQQMQRFVPQSFCSMQINKK